MQKTLDEWLDSSASGQSGVESEASSSSPVNANIPLSEESPTAMPKKVVSEAERRRQQEAEERRRRQEELKERMRNALGATALEPQASAGAKRGHVRSSSVASDDSTFSNVPTSLPPQAPRGSQDGGLKKLDPNQIHGEAAGGEGSDEHGIMVMDCGTQTTVEQECQTDPDPLLLSSPYWYQHYYGHTTAPLHGFVPFAAPTYGGGMGVGHMPMMNVPAAFVPGGALGGGQPMPTQQTVDVNAYRAQLRAVQDSVDSLINRYNLPPPPGMVQ